MAAIATAPSAPVPKQQFFKFRPQIEAETKQSFEKFADTVQPEKFVPPTDVPHIRYTEGAPSSFQTNTNGTSVLRHGQLVLKEGNQIMFIARAGAAFKAKITGVKENIQLVQSNTGMSSNGHIYDLEIDYSQPSAVPLPIIDEHGTKKPILWRIACDDESTQQCVLYPIIKENGEPVMNSRPMEIGELFVIA
jgi:hypothetical protein